MNTVKCYLQVQAMLCAQTNRASATTSSIGPEMKAITACCWIKTNLQTGAPHFISYATANHSNSFLLSNPQNSLRITILVKRSEQKVGNKR